MNHARECIELFLSFSLFILLMACGITESQIPETDSADRSAASASATSGRTGPYLLSYGVNAQNATPSYIRNNLSVLESLPYDGVGIRTDVGWEIMDPGNSISYETIMAELAPIRGLNF